MHSDTVEPLSEVMHITAYLLVAKLPKRLGQVRAARHQHTLFVMLARALTLGLGLALVASLAGAVRFDAPGGAFAKCIAQVGSDLSPDGSDCTSLYARGGRRRRGRAARARTPHDSDASALQPVRPARGAARVLRRRAAHPPPCTPAARFGRSAGAAPHARPRPATAAVSLARSTQSNMSLSGTIPSSIGLLTRLDNVYAPRHRHDYCGLSLWAPPTRCTL